MKLSEIVDALDAKVLVGDHKLDKEINTCGASDLMSDILAGLSEGSILLTGLTTVQVIRTASRGDQFSRGADVAANIESVLDVRVVRQAACV
jgi:hypothetical protein